MPRKNARFEWFTSSHLFDLILAIASVLAFPLISEFMDVRKREIPWDDRSIWFPVKTPSVSVECVQN